MVTRPENVDEVYSLLFMLQIAMIQYVFSKRDSRLLQFLVHPTSDVFAQILFMIVEEVQLINKH